MIDINGDGDITPEELKEVFKVQNDTQSKTIQDIIKEVDKNKDGKISFEEFYEGMKNNLFNGFLND